MIQATKVKSFSHLDMDLDWSEDVASQINSLSQEERDVLMLMLYETMDQESQNSPDSILMVKTAEYDRTPVELLS